MKTNSIYTVVFLFFITFVFSRKNLQAENIIQEKLGGSEFYYFNINLKDIKNNEIQVSLIPPKINADETEIIFNKRAIIKNIEGIDSKGKKINISSSKDNKFKVTNARELVKINFKATILSSFPNKSTSFVALDNASYLCQIKDNTNDVYRLDFNIPNAWNAYTSLEFLKEKEIYTLRTQNIEALNQSPLFFGIADTLSKKIGKQKYFFFCLDNDEKNSAYKISNTFYNELNAVNLSSKDSNNTNDKLMIFYFVKMDSLYEEITQNANSEIYTINENKGQHAIQKLIAFKKENVLSNQIKNSINIPKKNSQSWFLEGLSQYLKMKNDLQKQEKTKEFLYNWIQEKYIKNQFFQDTVSITDVNFNSKKDVLYFENKAPLLVMCLDIDIRNITQNKNNIEDLLPYFQNKYSGASIPDDELIFDIVRCYNNPKIADFLWAYVDGKDSLPLKTSLEKIGFTCSKKFEKKLLPGELSYSISDDNKIYVSKIGEDYLTKLSGLSLNDTIYSIDNQELNLQSFTSVFQNLYTKKMDNKISMMIHKFNQSKTQKENILINPSLNFFNTRFSFTIKENEKAKKSEVEMRKSIFYF